MKKSVLLSALIILLVSSLGFAATLKSLTKEQVTNAFQDKTITTIPLLTLNDKLVNNTITVYFAKDGKINGQFATKPDNDPQTDQGTWMVKANGTLCAKWDHMNNQKPICVFVYKLNNSLVFANADTNKFESMVLNENIKDGNQAQS